MDPKASSKRKFINAYLINCRSCRKKLPELYFLSVVNELDFLMLTETWADDSITDSMLSLNDYFNVYRFDRKISDTGGGIAILVRKGINCVNIEFSNNSGLEILAIDVFMDTNFRLILVYRPHHANDYQPYLDIFTNLLNDSHYPILLCGDFNSKHADWENLTSKNCIKYCSELIKFTISNGLKQLVDFNTREGSILDLVFTNDNTLITSVNSGIKFSDHLIVEILINNYCPPNKTAEKRYNYRKADFSSINYYLSWMNWEVFFGDSSVENCYTSLLNFLHQLISMHVPISKPFYQKYPAVLLTLHKRKLKEWRRHGNSEDYKKLCKKWKKEMYKFVSDKEKHLTKNLSKTEFFNYVKKNTKNKGAIGPIMDGDTNKLILEDNDKPKIFLKYFSSVFGQDNGIIENGEKLTNATFDITHIENYEIEKILLQMPNKVSNTPDNVPSIIFKQCATSLAYPLRILYQRSLDFGVIPEAWKSADVIPIYKKGSKKDPKNYRPISLTSNFCKVFEKFVKYKMTAYLVQYNLISKDQYGFIPRASTGLQLLSVLNFLYDKYNKNQPIDLIYIDYARAFDSVVHGKLMSKLENIGVAGKIFNWIRVYLENRRQRVYINGYYSDFMDVNIGTPQGGALSPLLFLLFINDLTKKLSHPSRLFADDLKIFGEPPLDASIKTTEKWSRDWQMEIAPKKSEVLHIGKNNQRKEYAINGQTIPTKTNVRDLGIYMSEDLSFTYHINEITSKAARTSNMLLRIFKTNNKNTLTRAFNVWVRPLLEYNSYIFNPATVNEVNLIESVQRNFTKRVFYRCHLPPLDYPARCKLLEIETLERRRIILDLVVFYKIFYHQTILNPMDFVRLSDPRTRQNHSNAVISILTPRNNVVQNYFFIRTTRIWNKLPPETRTAKNVNEFKNRLYELPVELLLEKSLIRL